MRLGGSVGDQGATQVLEGRDPIAEPLNRLGGGGLDDGSQLFESGALVIGNGGEEGVDRGHLRALLHMPTVASPPMGEHFSNSFQVRDQNPIKEGQSTGGAWIHHSERCSTVVAYFPPGGGMKPHFHETHDEIATVVDGEVEFLVDGEVRKLGPGDVVTIPAGTIHAPIHTEGGCTLVSVFAPWFDPENPDRVVVED